MEIIMVIVNIKFALPKKIKFDKFLFSKRKIFNIN